MKRLDALVMVAIVFMVGLAVTYWLVPPLLPVWFIFGGLANAVILTVYIIKQIKKSIYLPKAD